jgi:Polyketide cyclase / dehydrase and lipid transport
VARNEITIAAAPDAVWTVLADARCYGVWVVGSSAIRAADPDWPAPFTAFDHRVGLGPFGLEDCTEVMAAEPGSWLQLRAHARPLPPARVSLDLRPEGARTRVVMREEVDPAALRLALWPLSEPAVRLRNAGSLRRLKGLAEGTIPWPTGALPPRRAAVRQ